MSSTYTADTFVGDPRGWAEQQFGQCELGDSRRTRRLVDYAARQVAQPQASTNAVCGGDDIVAEGTYRWVRNSAVEAKAVDEGPFRVTARICANRSVVLAIQDSTTLTYSHAVADKLGTVTEVEGHRIAGILAHSTLMVDVQSREPLGLIDQQRWSRPVTDAASKPKRQKVTQQRKKRAYKEKESAKWEQATERMCGRLECSDSVITVCDREADVYDYLIYLTSRGRRFVIRAAQDRCLATRKGHLFDMLNGLSKQSLSLPDGATPNTPDRLGGKPCGADSRSWKKLRRVGTLQRSGHNLRSRVRALKIRPSQSRVKRF